MRVIVFKLSVLDIRVLNVFKVHIEHAILEHPSASMCSWSTSLFSIEPRTVFNMVFLVTP